MRLKTFFLVGLLAGVVSLGGCGKWGKDEVAANTPMPSGTEVTAVTPEAPEVSTGTASGQGLDVVKDEDYYTLKLAMRRPKTFNPLLNQDESVNEVTRLIFQDIFYINSEGGLESSILDGYSFSEDGRVLTLNIKSNIPWQKGHGYLNADDFLYSFQTLKNAPDTAIYKKYINNISSFRKVSNYVFEIQLVKAEKRVPTNLFFPVIPAGYYGNLPADQPTNVQLPVGNSTYYAESYDNKTLVLRNFDTYEQANIKKIQVDLVRDDIGVFNALARGRVDLAVGTLGDIGEYGLETGINKNMVKTNKLDFISFNFGKEYCNNIKFREAVFYSIPKEQIYDSIYLSFGSDVKTIYDFGQYYRETENFGGYNHNIKTANEILKGNNLLNEDGSTYLPELKILVNSESSERTKVATMVRNNLRGAGLSCSVVSVPFDEYLQKVDSGDFDILIGCYNTEYIPNFANLMAQGRGVLKIPDDNVNQLLALMENTLDMGEYTNCAYLLQDAVNNNFFVYPIIYNVDFILADEKVKNVGDKSYMNPFRSVAGWAIE